MTRLFALLAALLAVPVFAAEPQPAVELRVQSVNDLAGHLEYAGGVVGQAEQAKQFAELIKVFGGEKGVIEGVDLKRPLGAYVVIAPDFMASQVVVLLPVSDEKAFANLLKTRLSIEPKDEGGGVWKLDVPNMPVPVYFRMHQNYACVTVQDAKNIDPQRLLDAKAFFSAKEQALLALQVHLDRIPAELKKQLLAQIELKLADEFKRGVPNPKAKDLFGQWVINEGVLRGLKCAFDEGKTLALRLFVEPKSDDLTVVLTLSAKEGSDLAKNLKSLANKPALAALAAKSEHPVFALAVNAGVPESLKAGLATKLDGVLAEAKENATGDKELAGKAIDALAPTLKAGDYEIGAALTGEIGKLRLVSATRMVKGGEIEKVMRSLAATVPENFAKFEFDAAKTPAGSLHKVSVLNDSLSRLYGSECAWFSAGDSLMISSFEPEGELAKKAAAMKPGTSDALAVVVGWTQFQMLVGQPGEAELAAEAKDKVFGRDMKPGADELNLRVTGGEQLTVKLNVKGKLIEFLAKFDQIKKAK